MSERRPDGTLKHWCSDQKCKYRPKDRRLKPPPMSPDARALRSLARFMEKHGGCHRVGIGDGSIVCRSHGRPVLTYRLPARHRRGKK